MHLDPGAGARQLGWWSPDPRGVLPLDGLRLSRSLRKSTAGFRVTIDADFEAVIDACANPSRTGRWIVRSIREAYVRLHELGWAHSVEAWSPSGALVGGLYGIAIGGFFAGESMFHRQSDASKVALVGLVEQLRTGGAALLDVQWATPHLVSLGVVAIAKRAYLERLRLALELPLPAVFSARTMAEPGKTARNTEKPT
jgi:leucyl/phenylalanyl-tRNA--protein transferase